jgi:SAM-dependent methyltransferase
MGVDYMLFAKLAELSTRFKPAGPSLMLGRHSFKIQTQYRRWYEDILREYDLDGRRFDYLQEDGYAETLFDKLGFGRPDTLDFSDYEGANIVHDLSKPVPDPLRGTYHLIFDGGTLEHVFDVPQALRNVYDLLAPGGRFVSANGMNGWPGHGLYQFGPDLVWTFWQRHASCRVVSCQALRKNPDPGKDTLDLPDPAATGRRLRLKGKMPEGRVYLYYEIEKPESASLSGDVLQSDYETKWAGTKTAAPTSLDRKAS